MAELQIANRLIGENHPPAIIAEIGINHEGSLDLAITMADAAIDAGAEFVKHQTHIIEDEMSNEAKEVVPGNADVSIFEIMQRCALNEVDEYKLMNHVKSRGAIFISTPFSRAAVDRLVKFDVPAFKIGSGECNNYPLIKYISKFKKPVILSTGMNTLESVGHTVRIFKENNIQYALLHCTNVYPTPAHLVRLGAMVELMKAFPEAVIGLSDHTINNNACLGAVALGASILERHFTDSMSRAGPDILCSMDPKSLSDLIAGSKDIFLARGGSKGPVNDELPTIAFAFASVVTTKEIRMGEKLSEDNIWVKRPSGGDFSAIDYESLIGKVAIKPIPKGYQLKKTDIQ